MALTNTLREFTIVPTFDHCTRPDYATDRDLFFHHLYDVSFALPWHALDAVPTTSPEGSLRAPFRDVLSLRLADSYLSLPLPDRSFRAPFRNVLSCWQRA